MSRDRFLGCVPLALALVVWVGAGSFAFHRRNMAAREQEARVLERLEAEAKERERLLREAKGRKDMMALANAQASTLDAARAQLAPDLAIELEVEFKTIPRRMLEPGSSRLFSWNVMGM